jgi:hypothetical protein
MMQLIAAGFNRTSWLVRSLKGSCLVMVMPPCVQVMESGLQFFNEMFTLDSKRSAPLKLNESVLQVVSQNVLADLPELLQAIKKTEAQRSKTNFIIKY